MCVYMVLLEEVCHCGVGFEVSYAQDMPNDSVYFLWPMDQDIELFSSFSSTMSATMSHHDDNGLNLETVSHSNVFLCKSCHSHGVSSQQ